jgi:protein kinase
MKKYNIIAEIGDGTFGTVLKATNINSTEHMIVAIKHLKEKYTNWEKALNLSEIQALMKLQHPNIVKLLEVIKENNQMYLVFEYLQRNVYQVMKESELDIIQIRNIMFQTLQGIHYVHRKNLFHRDLKPENLLESQGTVKIADFGLAKNLNDPHPFTDYVSTRWYRAPEIILGAKDYDASIDIFAIGCIFAELIMKIPLFPGRNEVDQFQKIITVLGTPTKEEHPQLFKLAKKNNYQLPHFAKQPLKNIIKKADSVTLDLIERMIDLNPKNRITALEALQHEFFQVRLIKNQECLNLGSFKSKSSLIDNSDNTSKNKNFSKSRDSSKKSDFDDEDDFDDPVNFYLKNCRYKPGTDIYKLIKDDSNI